MCRLLGYLGQPIQLAPLLDQSENSLVVQSYQPKEMTAGLLNADGYGFGWYDGQKQAEPFVYKNILPIWNDINFSYLSRYIQSDCILANVRSATPGISVDISNCQPFTYGKVMGLHNGFIKNFRKSLYRTIRTWFDDDIYQNIIGNTDSEHIFALVMQLWKSPDTTLVQALQTALQKLIHHAKEQEVTISLNIILTDGERLVASRAASGTSVPSLYWLHNDPQFPNSALVASEPLFDSPNWQSLPEQSIIEIDHQFNVSWHEI